MLAESIRSAMSTDDWTVLLFGLLFFGIWIVLDIRASR